MGISCLTPDKKDIAAMRLPRPLSLSCNAAWRRRPKLGQVRVARARAHSLPGWGALDAAYLGGKRGRGAPGQTPFVAAVESNEAGHPQRLKLPVVTGFRRTDVTA